MPDEIDPEDQPSSAGEDEARVQDAVEEAELVVPEQLQEALKQLPDPARKQVKSLIFGQSTTRFGPDPETTKILARVEQHQESCKLEAYKAVLANQEQESVRDHDFRKTKLNREFWMSLVVVLGAVLLCGVGVYLTATGQTTLGSNLLIGGAGILLFILKGSSGFFGRD